MKLIINSIRICLIILILDLIRSGTSESGIPIVECSDLETEQKCIKDIFCACFWCNYTEICGEGHHKSKTFLPPIEPICPGPWIPNECDSTTSKILMYVFIPVYLCLFTALIILLCYYMSSYLISKCRSRRKNYIQF